MSNAREAAQLRNIRLFVAMQIVFAFAGGPFAVVWFYQCEFHGADVLTVATAAAYIALGAFLVQSVMVRFAEQSNQEQQRRDAADAE